jgi:prepilin-type N-terminal cleavage/methylation domain-containing protein
MKKNGFTLIELLVVIFIIGLLSSVVLVAVNGARHKARISKRVADLNNIVKALEIYYSDNSTYPNTFATTGTSAASPGFASWRSHCVQWTGSPPITWNDVIDALTPKYMASYPTDPAVVQPNQNCYMYSGNATNYKVMDYNITDMTMEDIQSHPELVDACRGPNSAVCGYNDGSLSWSLSTLGAKWW